MFGISRQAYYQNRIRQKEQLEIRSQVRELVIDRRRRMPRIGPRKLFYLLQPSLRSRSLKVGRDKLFSFLRMDHLLIKPQKSYTKTTDSKHWLRKYPNLIKDRTFDRAEQLWVSDITYIKTKQGNSYLSLVTDAVSRKIMGYHLSDDLRTEGVLSALRMAIKNRNYNGPLIHHSDRGLQYCSYDYQTMLGENNIQTSMTDGYDCYQNALAERMNGILKMEFLTDTYEDIKQTEQVISQSITTYNDFRPHLSLRMETPSKMHKTLIPTHKKTTRTLKGSCGFLTSFNRK